MDLPLEFPKLKSVEELQDKFFLGELPSRQNGHYYYRSAGLKAECGSVVLFQCDGNIIATAILTSVERFEKLDEKGYGGSLHFDVKSIKVFDPVGADQVSKIWPEFKRFSHAKLSLDPKRYPAFERKLTRIRPMTIAEQILKAVSKLVGSDETTVFSREEIRRQADVSRKDWNASYSPIFQGMREDQAGDAPNVGTKYKNVFRQVSYGRHALTEYGQQLAFFSTASAASDAPKPPASSGAGFGGPSDNKIVEEAAIAAIKTQYEGGGWIVRSVERERCGFDLECHKGTTTENIEVKGVRGTEQSFIITAGEVRQAQTNPKFVLIVVTSALSLSPIITRYSGVEFFRHFRLSPLQYQAVLQPSMKGFQPFHS